MAEQQQLAIRVYTIAAGTHQKLGHIFVSDNKKRFALEFFLGCDRYETFLTVDGDELAILSAAVSSDATRAIITVEYDEMAAGDRGSSVKMSLLEVMTPQQRVAAAQYNLQCCVQETRTAVPDPNRVVFCWTQTNHDLNG